MLPAGETEFDGQSEQSAGPNSSLYWLILHCEHINPFCPVYPALHSQAVFVVLPAEEVEFDGQAEQEAGPKPDLYWFIIHSEHVPPLSPVYPALHSQKVFAMLPAAEVEFDGQSEQVAGPNSSLYWLIMHSEHAPPFSPVYPALHSHKVFAMLPAGEIESEGHSWHVSVDTLTTSEYFAAAHAVHGTDPGLDLYLPATHPVQAPSVPVQPALQTQDVMLALPVFESAFTQSRHSDLSSAEYEPGSQSLHVSVDALTMTEYFPAAQ